MFRIITTAIIAIFLFSSAVVTQTVIWETYVERAKKAAESGNFTDAEKLFTAALKEARELNDSQRIAKTLGDFGALYMFWEKYPSAQIYLEQAVAAFENLGEHESDQIAYTLSNLGLAYAEQKQYVKAEVVLRKAITIREKLNSADLPVSLMNLGKTYADQKKTAEAEAIYQKALEQFLATENPNPDHVLTVMHNLALIFEETKNHKRLEAAYTIIIDLTARTYGANSKSLVVYLDKLATILRSQKRFSEANQLAVRANRIRKL
jgi:tetratricopeptide (TPR) repeat protein